MAQADMLTQEAAYKQIQDAKIMVEDDLQHKLDEFEEERERLIKLANTAGTLERELEQVAMPNVVQPLIFHVVWSVNIWLCSVYWLPFTLWTH